ncbi:hypothetical protein [Ancylobacter rudongensis]|uniref:Uncharacterized protein n=1 Tax=Ancylobacter rudongensis TaxID=177413 RepID=A0A1G4UPC5_9HYPH|nr:hypothetical protein [Ancylobacter rudongensis]SCW95500.1 hypothetical protein SAMN05660859_0042 [Ancylobacter rudongensis]
MSDNTTTENEALLNVADLLAIEDIVSGLENEAEALAETERLQQAESQAQAEVQNQASTDEASAEAGDTEEPVPTEATHVPGDLKEMMDAVPQEDVDIKIAATETEFSVRAAFEKAKNPSNLKMQQNLTAYGKRLASPIAAKVLCATDVDPEFLNREISNGSRFNVYAMDKVADLVTALSGGVMQNAINRAITRSMFKFRAAGVPFTGIAAQAASSDKVKVDRKLAQLLIRHTVSAATAPTQTSSTMSALAVMGIVRNTGSQKYPVYELTDTPQTRRLEEVLAKAA